MDVVDIWNGLRSCALQTALRMTNEDFASHLGIGVRTVASWHENPDLEQRADMQQVLDMALEKSDAGVRSRFILLAGAERSEPQPGRKVRLIAAGRHEPSDGLYSPRQEQSPEFTRRVLLAESLAGDGPLPGFSLLEAAEAIRREMEDTLASGTVPPARLARIEETIAAHLREYTTTPPATALAGLLLDFMDVRHLCAERQPAMIQARLSEIATLLATLAADSLMKLGRIGEARAWYGTARMAADDSTNRELRARVRAQEAMLPYYYGAPAEVVRLARDAQELLDGAPRAAGALAAAAEARALARLGLRPDAEAAMSRAQDLAEQVHEPDSDEAFRFGERRLLFYLSGTLTSLGDAARADQVQARALELYGDVAPVIDPTLIRLDQAQLLVLDGDLDGACAVTHDACLSIAPEFRTRVLAARVRQIAEALPRDHEARRALHDLYRTLFSPPGLS